MFPLRVAAAVAAVVTAAATDATFLFIEHFTVDKLDTTDDEGGVQADSKVELVNGLYLDRGYGHLHERGVLVNT